MQKPFLTAEWRKLAMANYEVNPAVLKKHLPHNTEFDLFNNTCYISLVGFMFTNTRLKSFPVPFHRTFEEVNLRFYVKHRTADGEWKRGVVFVKEIVPKPMLTLVANTVYKERYQTMRMDHHWKTHEDTQEVSYRWKSRHYNSLSVITQKNAELLVTGSEEEFITEHYWGYTKVGPQKTLEYKVEHPQWHIYKVKEHQVEASFGELYGSEFSFLNKQKPLSVFLAEGSEIKVFGSKKLNVNILTGI